MTPNENLLTIGQTATFQRAFSQPDFDRFAVLSGDDNPIHVDEAFSARTRFGHTVAHGMFLYSNICRLLGNELPGPGTVQIEQELKFPTPTYTAEEVIFSVVVSELPAPGLARLETYQTRPNGERGLEGITLVRLPGVTASSAGSPDRKPGLPSSASEHKGLHLGDEVSLQRVYSIEDLWEYRDLVGDQNPIFQDDQAAHQAGFAGKIIPNGLLGGLISYLLGVKLPGRGTNWLKQKLLFPGPAYPGEVLTARVEITRLRPEKDLVNLRSTITKPDGSLACDGEALVYVRDLEV